MINDLNKVDALSTDIVRDGTTVTLRVLSGPNVLASQTFTNASTTLPEELTVVLRAMLDEVIRGSNVRLGGAGGNIAASSGVTEPYWGPTTATSVVMKPIGGRPVTFGQHFVTVKDGGSKFRATLLLASGVGEVVQGLSPATQGYGDWYVNLVYKGVSYPGYPVDSVDRFGNVVSAAGALGVDQARTYFGDIGTMEFDLGDVYVPPNTELMYKIACRQTPHTDGVLAGQTFISSAGNRGRDVMAASIPITEAQWADWVTACKSPALTAEGSLPTTNVVYDVGIRLHNLYALTTRRTYAIFGDSKSQGGQNEGGLWLDHTSEPMFGEGSNMYGAWYGISNLGYAGEAVGQFGVVSFPEDKTKCFRARAKLAAMCTDADYGYGYNSLTLSALWTGETTCVSAYQAEFDWIKSQCPNILRWFPRTITPSFTSTDFMTSIALAVPNRDQKILAILNGAIRKGSIIGSSGHSDAAGAVCQGPLNLAPYVHPRARTINTGNATITVSAATGSLPAITTMSGFPANTWSREDEGAYIVVPGIANSGGIYRAQVQFVDDTSVRLIQRNSEDAPTAMRANQLNGNVSSLVVNFATNALYIWAETYFSDAPAAGGAYLHYGDRAHQAMRRFNITMGNIKPT